MSISSSDGVRWAVQVELGPTHIVSKSKNTFITYTFHFHIGKYTHQFTSRYSRLRKFHEQLSNTDLLKKAFSTRNTINNNTNNARNTSTHNSIPIFPPKRWLTDMTKPHNYQKRAQELLLYFKRLVSKPIILKNEQFQIGIQLDKHLRLKMNTIADDFLAMKHLTKKYIKKPQEKISNKTTFEKPLQIKSQINDDPCSPSIKLCLHSLPFSIICYFFTETLETILRTIFSNHPMRHSLKRKKKRKI